MAGAKRYTLARPAGSGYAEVCMRLATIVLTTALTLLPAIDASTAVASAPGASCYYYHGHYYRYRFNGRYYSYHWHGHYYSHRYRCSRGWCYR